MPSAGALDPCAFPAVLTEAGQPCRFPFRYGGRMLHSCTSEGSAHRKWWVLVLRPVSTLETLPPLPSLFQTKPGTQQVS